jgi:hypothetical protein
MEEITEERLSWWRGWPRWMSVRCRWWRACGCRMRPGGGHGYSPGDPRACAQLAAGSLVSLAARAELVRQAMRKWAFNPSRRETAMPPNIEAALRWLARSSVPMSALQEASLIGKALDACGRKLDDTAAAPEYYRRRRRIFYGALKYAVREKHLSANPLDGSEDPEWKAPEVANAVDQRRVANPAQMRQLLDAIRIGDGRGDDRALSRSARHCGGHISPAEEQAHV